VNAVDVIRAKRDANALSAEQIRYFVDGYTRDEIAHEHAAALLMAIVWRGMNSEELTEWTRAMIASGERLDLRGIGRPTADKHSTGGVGDKVSLVLAPLVAACGVAVPMVSGRGLGHTGGTLDKLEAIPGFRVDLDRAEMLDCLRSVGCVICAAGAELAPADRKLYALRDVTGTVESLPLIASSIMSKKIAEGAESLVLDVKVGSGAFLPDLESARALAETMVQLGTDHGVKTAALLTDMETPLGMTAGHALEVQESIDVLRGGGPPDVLEVTLELAETMLQLAGVEADAPAALRDGRALDVWRAMVEAQGGDADAPLPEARIREEVRAPRGGYVTRLDARGIGHAAWRLGAGRARRQDPVSATAGVTCLRKVGDEVAEGEPVLMLHTDDPQRLKHAHEALRDAIHVGPERPDPRAVVLERTGV
jgi:thymidine phosphorylase